MSYRIRRAGAVLAACPTAAAAVEMAVPLANHDPARPVAIEVTDRAGWEHSLDVPPEASREEAQWLRQTLRIAEDET